MLTLPNSLVRLKSLSCKGNWITEKNYNCFYKTLETLIKYFGNDYIQDNLWTRFLVTRIWIGNSMIPK